MTHRNFTSICIMVAIVAMMLNQYYASPARADDAARSWSQSMSYSTPSQQAVDYSKARDRYLLRKGIIPGANVVTNTQNCQVAGACQNGGSSTNINGYSSNTITGNNNDVGVGITTDNTSQDASTASNVADDIGSINFN